MSDQEPQTRTSTRPSKRAGGTIGFGIFFAVIALVLLAAPIAPRLSFTDVDTIDRDFDGLFAQEPGNGGEAGAARRINLLIVHGIGRHCIGYADRLATGIARMAGLGYADPQQHLFSDDDCASAITDYNRLENDQLELCQLINNESKGDRSCHRLRLETNFVNPGTGAPDSTITFPGYIRVQDYETADGAGEPLRLRLYELTWDPATRWAKSFYVSDHDREFDESREFLNRHLKRRIINESISDAVLYLGQYQPVMQYPILMAFCKILSDSVIEPGAVEDEFTCDLNEVANALESGDGRRADDEVAIITHSLGSRMMFDALGAIAGSNFLRETERDLESIGVSFDSGSLENVSSEKVEAVIARFRALIDKVFVLSNQVPLLELRAVRNPASFDLNPVLGERFAKFLQDRVSHDDSVGPLQLVAFTDPNDLLSYNLKCWYYLTVLKRHKEVTAEKVKDPRLYEKYFDRCTLADDGGRVVEAEKRRRQDFWNLAEDYVNITDVSVYLAGPGYPYVFADPTSAHSRYFSDETIFRLIACGGSSESQAARDCPDG